MRVSAAWISNRIPLFLWDVFAIHAQVHDVNIQVNDSHTQEDDIQT